MFKFSQVSFTLEGHFRHSYSRFPRNCNQTPRIWDCNYPAKFPHSSVPKPPLGLSWIQQTLAWKYSWGKALHWTIWDSTSLQGWGGHWLSMVGELRLLVSCGFCGPPGLPVMAQHGSKPSEHCVVQGCSCHLPCLVQQEWSWWQLSEASWLPEAMSAQEDFPSPCSGTSASGLSTSFLWDCTSGPEEHQACRTGLRQLFSPHWQNPAVTATVLLLALAASLLGVRGDELERAKPHAVGA